MGNLFKKISFVFIVLTLLTCCTMVFAVNLPTNPGYNENNLTSSEIKTKADSIMNTIVYLVQITCVITVIAMGLRYMLTSAEGKANIKKELVVWCVGAVIVFSATTLIGLILEFVTGNDEITITPSTSTNPNANPNLDGNNDDEVSESDKEVSDWASDYWEGAKSVGLVPSSIKNKPKAKISRVEFVEAIYSLAQKYNVELDIPEDALDVSDVDSSSLKKKIQKLYNAGIITGTGKDTNGNIIFRPDNDITRQDVATIVYRLLEISGKKNNSIKITSSDKSSSTYSGVDDYAKEAMIYMNKAGIIIGDEKGNINPKGNTTCEQAITILYRIYSGKE